MGLKELRKEVWGIDKQIIDLLSKRMNLTIKINKEKIKKNKPVHNKEQVKKVMERTTDYATEKNLNSNTVKKIFQLIIKESEEKQHELRGERSIL